MKPQAYPLPETPTPANIRGVWFTLLCLLFSFSSAAPNSCIGIRDACFDPGAFCFPSTLPGFLAQDGVTTSATKKPDSGASEQPPPGPMGFPMPNGDIVTCSLVEAASGLNDGLIKSGDGRHDVTLCQAPLVPDNWMRASNGVPPELDGNSDDVGTNSLFGLSLMNVEITPPVLDWGSSTGLYSASLAFLTVVNLDNDSALHVFEPFSTDHQFYVYGYEDLVIEPGENASIGFVFLPKVLGSSSAHLVLQTSFGGFVIQAKGVAVESPYRIEPLVGFDVLIGGGLKRNLSVYNPFDDDLLVEEVVVWVSSSESTDQSSHVVCHSGSFQETVESVSLSNDWYTAGTDEFNTGIRPREQWEVQPRESNAVVEVNLQPDAEGKVFGAVCMKLRNSLTGTKNTVVIPIELQVHGRPAYSDSSNLVSVSFDCHDLCDGSGSIFSFSLRNDAPKVISILSISEEEEKNPMIFQVKYIKGLMLFPGSATQVALIVYRSPADPESISLENCNIVIETNSSASSLIKVPCQDLVRASSRDNPSSSAVVKSDGSYVGMLSQGDETSTASARTGYLGSILEDTYGTKPTLLRVEADDMILKNWKSQGTRAGISVLKDQELLFPVVQVGSQSSKWITVHNPSHEPALIQLVMNSEETIDDCKRANDASDHTFSSRSPEIDSTETRFGFSLKDLAITEAYVHPSESAAFGPVVFHPSNRCMWSSSALIRSNLSGVEWLPIRAYGGLHSVVLSVGSETVWKLEFNLGLACSHNVSSLPQRESPSASCNQQLSKEIHVRNTGELPLEVKRVSVSGTVCGVDGFRVDNCKGFGLTPGDSMQLQVSYQPDFSSAMVQRDLELAMGTGIFVIPMTANIPVCMLNQCRKSYLRSIHWKASVIVFCVFSVLLFVLVRLVPHSFIVGSEEYYLKIDNSRSAIPKDMKSSFLGHSNQTSRLAREDKKPEGTYIDKYPIYQNGVLDGPKGMEGNNNSDNQKTLTPSSSTSKIHPVEDPRGTLENSGNLTIRVTREKGRRRKRKATGGGLAAKFEVSSSHSGNSTPSSPLSPSASTPKLLWPAPPDPVVNPFSARPEEQKHHKKHDGGSDVEASVSSTENCYNARWSSSTKKQPSLSPTETVVTTVSGSAPFAAVPWRAPAVPSSVLLSASSIAPHARAPGSNLKDKAVKREDNAVVKKEFTYDIWADNFSGHLLGKAKEVSSKVFDASDGDSRSFFAREPQSLLMKPSALPVLSRHVSPRADVTSANEIN